MSYINNAINNMNDAQVLLDQACISFKNTTLKMEIKDEKAQEIQTKSYHQLGAMKHKQRKFRYAAGYFIIAS